MENFIFWCSAMPLHCSRMLKKKILISTFYRWSANILLYWKRLMKNALFPLSVNPTIQENHN